MWPWQVAWYLCLSLRMYKRNFRRLDQAVVWIKAIHAHQAASRVPGTQKLCTEHSQVLLGHCVKTSFPELPPGHSAQWCFGCCAVSKMWYPTCDGRRPHHCIKCSCKQTAPHCPWGMNHGVSEGWISEEHPIKKPSVRESWLYGSRSSSHKLWTSQLLIPQPAQGSISLCWHLLYWLHFYALYGPVLFFQNVSSLQGTLSESHPCPLNLGTHLSTSNRVFPALSLQGASWSGQWILALLLSPWEVTDPGRYWHVRCCSWSKAALCRETGIPLSWVLAHLLGASDFPQRSVMVQTSTCLHTLVLHLEMLFLEVFPWWALTGLTAPSWNCPASTEWHFPETSVVLSFGAPIAYGEDGTDGEKSTGMVLASEDLRLFPTHRLLVFCFLARLTKPLWIDLISYW